MTQWLWHRGWIGLSVLLWVSGTATLVLAVAGGSSPYILAIASPSLILVGLVIGIRRPEVRVGQLLAISGGAFAWTFIKLPTAPDGPLPIVIGSSLIYPFAAAALIGALLAFPDGSLRSTRWWWVAAALVVWPVVDGVVRVLGVLGLGGAWPVRLDQAWFVIGMVLMAASLASLVLRARTGTGVVRRQVGWLAYGVASYIVFLFVTVASLGIDDDDPRAVLIDQIFFTAIPLAIWVAVSRHRLYDLDRLVSRTAGYVMVIGVLAATYLGAFALFSAFLPVEDEIGVAVATLAAVAAFSPVRRRVLSMVDRRFFRTRYRAQEVFDGFARRLRGQTMAGPSAIEHELTAVLGETLAPESVSVWVRSS